MARSAPAEPDEMVWEMESIVEQIRLLNDNVASDAAAIYEAHKKCEDDYPTSSHVRFGTQRCPIDLCGWH